MSDVWLFALPALVAIGMPWLLYWVVKRDARALTMRCRILRASADGARMAAIEAAYIKGVRAWNE